MSSVATLTRQATAPQSTERLVRRIKVGDIEVRYIEAGIEHDGPPLLMLHGYQAGADYWFPRGIPGLATEHHIIAPDLPGFAYSGILPEYSVAAYAAFVHRFLDTLDLEKVNVLGHSMGGQVAIGATALDPSRVGKLVLVDAAGLPRPMPRWQEPVRMLTDRSMLHVGLYAVMVRLGIKARAKREAMLMLQADHVSHLLDLITVPTLVVWGSRDRITPLEHGALLAKHIPNARLAVIRGAGHLPFYQKPRQFSRIVLAFLRGT